MGWKRSIARKTNLLATLVGQPGPRSLRTPLSSSWKPARTFPPRPNPLTHSFVFEPVILSSFWFVLRTRRESKDPFELITGDTLWHAVNKILADPGNAVGRVGVLRLRDCFAKRSNHSAQDDRASSAESLPPYNSSLTRPTDFE